MRRLMDATRGRVPWQGVCGAEGHTSSGAPALLGTPRARRLDALCGRDRDLPQPPSSRTPGLEPTSLRGALKTAPQACVACGLLVHPDTQFQQCHKDKQCPTWRKTQSPSPHGVGGRGQSHISINGLRYGWCCPTGQGRC